MKTTQIRDDAHWHRLRSEHVGGSEVAALFGEHAQLTKFELWHQKNGTLPTSFEETKRMTWGKRLEATIAAGVAERADE